MLLIDAGNSRLKWAWADPSGLGEVSVLSNDALEEALLSAWQGLPVPEQVWFSNSAGRYRQQQIATWVEQLWGGQPTVLKSAVAWRGLTNGYRNPQQLGVDRWLGLVAGWVRTQDAFCLIDCGTAITIDYVDQRGEHQGGVIFPGVGSTLERLLERAPHLKLGEEAHRQRLLGRSTEEGLRDVEEAGAVEAVRQLLWQMEQQYGSCSILLTGGDAERLLSMLSLQTGYFPDLVLEGVLRVAKSGGSQ